MENNLSIIKEIRATKMNDKNNLKEKIVKILSERVEGLSILEISSLAGSHRHTVTKYIHELIGAGLIYQRDLGTVKLHYLKDKLTENQMRFFKKFEKNQ